MHSSIKRTAGIKAGCRSFVEVIDKMVAKKSFQGKASFWNNVLWSDITEIEMFCNKAHSTIWPHAQHTNAQPRGGWKSPCSHEPAINFSEYQNILKLKLRPSVRKLKLASIWVSVSDQSMIVQFTCTTVTHWYFYAQPASPQLNDWKWKESKQSRCQCD